MRKWAIGVLLLAWTVAFAGGLDDAAAAFQREDLSSAATILHGILESHPNDAAALGLLGAVLDREKKYTAAEAAYKHALRLTPNSPSLLNNYANHQFATGDLAGARATYLKVIRLDPSRANANLQLAVIAVREKNGAEALDYLDHLQPAQRSQPDIQILEMKALFLAGRDNGAQSILGRLSASGDPRVNFSTGLALASLQKYQDAEAAFSRALKEAPANFDVLYNLGLAAYHARHLQRARDVLQTALAQRPRDIDTLYNLAQIDIDLKGYRNALTLLAKAARLDRSRPDVQLSIAKTARELGYYPDSLIAYNKYLALKPHDDSVRRERAFMIAAAGNLRKGRSALEEFLHSHPRDKTAQYELGIVEALSNPKDALLHFNTAIKLDPQFVPAHFGRGLLNLQQGKLADALPDLRFAAAHSPDSPAVLDRLGETYLALDQAPNAIRTLRKAAKIAPRDTRILLHLSRAYAKAGQKQAARETLARFRALPPEEGHRVPAAGMVEYLGLPPRQLQARYRDELARRLKQNPENPGLSARFLKILINEGEMDQARQVAAHLLQLKPQARVAAKAGHALVEAGLYAAAKPLLAAAADARTPAPELQLDLAIATFHLAGVQAGLAQIDRIPEPQRSGDYYLAQAQMLDASGKPREALAALERALHAGPTRADLYEQAALFLARRRRAAEAVRLLNQAPGALANNPKILLMKAAMLAASKHPDAAERLLKKIQNRWPAWAPSYVTYGILLEGEKRASEAKTQLETAVALGTSQPGAFLYLARAVLDATPDKIEDAAKAIQQALALAPHDPQVLAVAGRIDYQEHDYTAAVQHLEEAVRLKPDYPQARFTLAEAYRALGRKKDAAREAREFQRLRAQNPNRGDDWEKVESQPSEGTGESPARKHR